MGHYQGSVGMCPKRKLFVAYIGRLTTSVDAPWTIVHMGYTTYMAKRVCLSVRACLPSGSLSVGVGKHVCRWVLQVPTHLCTWGWEGIGGYMCSCVQGRQMSLGITEHGLDGFFCMHVGR